MPYSSKMGRPNDFMYDPSYIVSGAKDFYKQANNARMATAQYAVCPIFPTMFSDLRNYPRKQYVIRRTGHVPQYVENSHEAASFVNKATILGQDRHKHFHNPVSGANMEIPKLDMSCFYSIDEDKRRKEEEEKVKKCCKHVKVQTKYRESSAQTSPWQPDYKVIQGDPELLKLDFLKWGINLPAGVHEVTLIERMRKKLNWEKSMPDLVDQKSFDERRNMIEAMEREQWIFREQEIEDIQALRLELLERMLNELHEKDICRSEKKMRLYTDLKIKEKKEKIAQLHKNSTREHRRLEFNYKGILTKYGPVNIFTEHADYKSELYIPLIRHGYNPRYGHAVFDKASKKSQYYKVELFNTLPTNLAIASDIKDVKVPGTRLCIRETKWTSHVLAKLHQDLKNLRCEEKKEANLRVRIEKEIDALPTPEIDSYNEQAEENYQDCVFLQKIVRGRAAQVTIFEGRERCRELIEELRGTYALLKGNIEKKIHDKEKTKYDQFNASRCMQNLGLLEANLKKLGGYVVGTLLDFLNKELTRLNRERKAHAMALLVERERITREAEESGRRQKEIRRRKEHDEIFKQIVKVHQDTVDLYLEDIILEGNEFASKQEAKSYIQQLSFKIDEECKVIEANKDNVIFKEEYIADLVHHFVIPEVEKQIVRQCVKQRQLKFLKTAHEEIYDGIELLPNPKVVGKKAVLMQLEDIPYTESQLSIARRSRSMSMIRERQVVMSDIRNILNELIDNVPKIHVLDNLKPCYDELKLDEINGEDSHKSGIVDEDNLELNL